MSEMVEKVARAICLAEFGDENVHGEARCCQVGGVDGCCLGEVLPVARAAIDAMHPAISPELDKAIQDELDHPPASIMK